MERLAYYFFRLMLGLFRVLPFWVLYGISSFLSFVLYRLLGYRRKVVQANLKRCFPEKTEAERQTIEKEFYKHLGDLIVEGIKGLTMSPKMYRKRFELTSPEVLNQYQAQNQSIIGMAGHCGNWEWGGTGAPIYVQHTPVVLFAPLKNRYINDYFKRSREQHDSYFRSVKETSATFAEFHDKNAIFVLAADQNPSNLEDAHWVDFFGIDTAALHGGAKYAQRYNLPLILLDIEKIKRGHYQVHPSVIAENPNEFDPQELTQRFMKGIEARIRKQPAYWLWSHKRWKHSREKDG